MAATKEISIIMPVHNMERYVDQALETVSNQDFKDWECIVVDDGSTDKSASICDAWAAKDPRIKVIHKPQGGVSSARNRGLAEATGRYITFVDSDDWVDSDFLSTLHNLIQRYDADIAQTGFLKEFRGFNRKKPLVAEEEVIERSVIPKKIIEDNTLPSYLWNKLFKREILEDVTFPEGKIYEDFDVFTSLADKINRIAFSPVITYHYRMRKRSITHDNCLKNLADYLASCEMRANKINSVEPSEFDDEKKNIYLYKLLVKVAKTIAREEPVAESRIKAVEEIRTRLKGLPEMDKTQVGSRNWERGKLILENPEAFIRKMQFSGKIDLHKRFCEYRKYK